MPVKLTFPIKEVQKIVKESTSHVRLVKDSGIFLMNDKDGQTHPVYAHGYDPTKSGEFTVRSRSSKAMGPQDLIVIIERNLFRDVFQPNTMVCIVDFVSRNDITVGVA